MPIAIAESCSHEIGRSLSHEFHRLVNPMWRGSARAAGGSEGSKG